MPPVRRRAKKRVTLPPSDHPALQEPSHSGTFIGSIIRSLSEEARALLFVIYLLGCLLFAFALTQMILWPEHLPRAEAPAAASDERPAAYFVPAT